MMRMEHIVHHQLIHFKHALSWVFIPHDLGLLLSYIALDFIRVYHIHSIELTRSTYPFMSPLLYYQRKNKNPITNLRVPQHHQYLKLVNP
jgi:hypothetical protein